MIRRTVVSTPSPIVVVVEVIVRGRPLLRCSITGVWRRAIAVTGFLVLPGGCWTVVRRVHILGRLTHGLRSTGTRWHATTRTGRRSIVWDAITSWGGSCAAHVHLRVSCRHGHASRRRSKVLLRVAPIWRAIAWGSRRRSSSLVRIVLWWILAWWSSTGAVHWRSPAVPVSRQRRHRPTRRSLAVSTRRGSLAAGYIHALHLMCHLLILLEVVLSAAAWKAWERTASARAHGIYRRSSVSCKMC